MSNEEQGKPAEVAQDAPQGGMLGLAEAIEIEQAGARITGKVRHFPALTGWEIRRQYREFLESKDSGFRMAFTVTVLSHAVITTTMDGQQEDIRLSDPDTINRLLGSWQNVETVFNAVLGYNGIRADAAEAERRRWQVAGEDMAGSFLAAVSSMIGPALNIASGEKG